MLKTNATRFLKIICLCKGNFAQIVVSDLWNYYMKTLTKIVGIEVEI